jgi:23S rRNA pseudouridine2605 synthase
MEERLQKLMSQAGVASRRESESLITQGRVTINGKKAVLGDKADPETDDIRVDGERLRIEQARIYIAIYKPKGIVTTVRAQEQEHRRTVRDLVPIEGHLYPVGRLDVDSEGLVILTNDGELAQKLTHPRYEHPKIYDVVLYGVVPDATLDIWRRGVVLDDGPTKSVDVKVLSRDKDQSTIRITMQEGRKRQIRRIGKTLGYPVKQLVRVQLDTVKLGNLKPKEWRNLSEEEVAALQASAASTPHRSKVTRPQAVKQTLYVPESSGKFDPDAEVEVKRKPRPAGSAPRPRTGGAGRSPGRRPSGGPARRSPGGRSPARRSPGGRSPTGRSGPAGRGGPGGRGGPAKRKPQGSGYSRVRPPSKRRDDR